MKFVSVIIVLIILGVVFSGISLIYVFGILNKEAQSRNQIQAQIKVVEAHYDKMWKVIQQKTQITQASANFQKELVKTLIEGRSASFIKIINESNPNAAFSLEQFTSLSNSVEGQREGFFREQEEMIDIVRENHLLFDTQPRGSFLFFFGRTPTGEPILISSSGTKQIMKTGEENDIVLPLGQTEK